jgi:hypothetical protein
MCTTGRDVSARLPTDRHQSTEAFLFSLCVPKRWQRVRLKIGI